MLLLSVVLQQNSWVWWIIVEVPKSHTDTDTMGWAHRILLLHRCWHNKFIHSRYVETIKHYKKKEFGNTLLKSSTHKFWGKTGQLYFSSHWLKFITIEFLLETFSNYQLNAQFFYFQQYVCYTTLLNMFRAARYSS